MATPKKKPVKKAAPQKKKAGVKAKPGDKRIGNSFWTKRSKHGRDRIFQDPELLRIECYRYFKHCDDNPWFRNEAVKSGDLAGAIMKVPTQRPYSRAGLCVFLRTNESFWRNFRKQMKANQDFSAVIAEIDHVIDAQQWEGAAVGAFKENLIARTLGLAEKTENDNTNLNTNLPDMAQFPDEALMQIGEMFKKYASPTDNNF